MKEKLAKIEKVLMERDTVDLGKQCKGEYIIYNFYLVDKKKMIVRRMQKEHYSDATLKHIKKTSNHTLINKPLREVIDNDIYQLLLKGYDLLQYNN